MMNTFFIPMFFTNKFIKKKNNNNNNNNKKHVQSWLIRKEGMWNA